MNWNYYTVQHVPTLGYRALVCEDGSPRKAQLSPKWRASEATAMRDIERFKQAGTSPSKSRTTGHSYPPLYSDSIRDIPFRPSLTPPP